MRRRECWLGAQQGCCVPHLPSVGRVWSAGAEELGRTGTFSKCSQREPGLPTNLVMSKLVSQILLSLERPCLLASLALGCKTDFLRC